MEEAKPMVELEEDGLIEITLDPIGDNHRCNQCKRSFTNSEDLDLHQTSCKGITVEVQENQPNNQCKICKKTFKGKRGARAHASYCKETSKHELHDLNVDVDVNLAQPEKLIKCGKCTKMFKYKDSYLKHLRNEHSKLKNSIACNECNARCPNKAILEEHIKNAHVRIGQFRCEYCGKEFARNYHVLRHIRQSGCAGNTANEHKCEICLAVFTRKDNLFAHLRSHLRRKEYACKICDAAFARFNKYFLHHMQKHMEKRFECDLCGRVNKSRGALVKHFEAHGEKKHTCGVCGYSTQTAEVLKRHALRHVARKPYPCTQCPRSFIQPHQLRAHLRTCNTRRECADCGRNFKSHSAYLIHTRKHSGLPPLLCGVAGCSAARKPFATPRALQDHAAAHQQDADDEVYTCGVCSKAFRDALALRRHADTHALEPARRCMYCVSARAYVRGGMLLRHVRTRHADTFRRHLRAVREQNGVAHDDDRVRKEEAEQILQLLDAVAARILQQSRGRPVLYGGIQETHVEDEEDEEDEDGEELKPAAASGAPQLLGEEELAARLRQLVAQLVDADTLRGCGWPDQPVDVILERVVAECGLTPADRARWSRVQRLRENAKHFLTAMEHADVASMLGEHTVDHVVLHLLQASEGVGDSDSDQ